MPIYLYWGDDDYSMAQAVTHLKEKILDPNWIQFNYDKISNQQSDGVITALNQAMTPVFGVGDRLVWLEETNLCQQAAEDLLPELQRTLPNIPASSHLLLTTTKKPDGRLKSTKLLEKYAQVQEFSLIPPWKPEEIFQKVQQLAQEMTVKLTPQALQLLADSVGNNTRQLAQELTKLKLYAEDGNQPINAQMVMALVNVNTQSSLQLATAIRNGEQGKSLELVADLLNHNEAALRIVATLVGQFRTWTVVRLGMEAKGMDEKAIASLAEISNPKRLFFLRKEVQNIPAPKFLATLPLLLDLEYNLKRGAEPLITLQTKVLELCQIFQEKTRS
jgi:DNA polymerase-3 subunit delta